MRFMAIKTGRFDAMLIGMTAGTSHLLIVLARIRFHFLAFGLVMARLTGNNWLSSLCPDFLGHGREGNVLGRMGIFMALETLGKGLAMW